MAIKEKEFEQQQKTRTNHSLQQQHLADFFLKSDRCIMGCQNVQKKIQRL